MRLMNLIIEVIIIGGSPLLTRELIESISSSDTLTQMQDLVLALPGERFWSGLTAR